jgi:hypothetical protein
MKLKLIASALALLAAGWAQASSSLEIHFARGEPFSPATHTLPGHPDKPMLVSTGGKHAVEDGKLVLANGRFAIGAVAEAGGKLADSSAADRPDGVLDLSKPYRITIRVAEAVATLPGKDNFFIYVNNSTSKRGESPLGGNSQLVKASVGELKPGDNVFEGRIGDARSFVQIRAESGAEVKIESIRIAPI